MTPLTNRPPDSKRIWLRLFYTAVLLIVAGARLRLLNFPLERDEGEYAYAGQFILQGIPPYELAYNMKFPGTYLAYAAIMALFRPDPGGNSFPDCCLMTTATALMLYWLGKKILDETAGLIAAAGYAHYRSTPGSPCWGRPATRHNSAARFRYYRSGCASCGACGKMESWPVLAASGALFGTAVLNETATRPSSPPGRGYHMPSANSSLEKGGDCAACRIYCGLWIVHAHAAGPLLPVALARRSISKPSSFGHLIMHGPTLPLCRRPARPSLFWKNIHGWVITSGILLWLLAASGLVLAWLDPRV